MFGARGVAVLALCLGLGACVGAGSQEDALYYVAPKSAGQATIMTDKDVAEVAAILRGAGLGEVRAGSGTLTLLSGDVRLVDCGTFVQVAMGNRAEFPATSSDAVLMEGFQSPGLVQRKFATSSTVRLTRQADGKGYAVTEAHKVTRTYQVVDSRKRSSSSVSFDGTSEGVFSNKTSCRSSGIIAALLR
ncbi:MAG TPA: hypothetical protein VK146_10710 [Tabrizicola sp.]|nr:hypothetical protein [Tabrizicola sp.]